MQIACKGGAATYLWWLTKQEWLEVSDSAIHIESLPGEVPGLSWPSCPQLLEPHVYTLPSYSRNNEWCPPQATSFSPLPWNIWQFLGSNTAFLSIPVPNCPSFALPQPSMVVRGRDEHQFEARESERWPDGRGQNCSGLRPALISLLDVSSTPGGNTQRSNVICVHCEHRHIVLCIILN